VGAPPLLRRPSDIQATFFNRRPFTASTPDGQMIREPLAHTGYKNNGTPTRLPLPILRRNVTFKLHRSAKVTFDSDCVVWTPRKRTWDKSGSNDRAFFLRRKIAILR
jgi:hypothetical protein